MGVRLILSERLLDVIVGVLVSVDDLSEVLVDFNLLSGLYIELGALLHEVTDHTLLLLANSCWTHLALELTVVRLNLALCCLDVEHYL